MANELKEVPTVEYSDRNDVLPYLGFRHITGVKKWEPLTKARYVAALVRAGRKLDDLESAIGDGAQTVRKLYQAFVVYEQIRLELEEDVQNIKESFSLLEVMLSQQPIKTHLGLPRRLPVATVERLVDTAHLEALRETVRWVFGSKRDGTRPVIGDSRDIPERLAPVISKAESLQYLRETRDLEAAFEHTGGEHDYALKQINSARRSAERALGASPQFKGDATLVSAATQLAKVVSALEGVVTSCIGVAIK